MEMRLKETGEIRQTATLNHHIRVVKFDNRTEREAWVIAIGAGIIGLLGNISGIIGVLNDLGAF